MVIVAVWAAVGGPMPSAIMGNDEEDASGFVMLWPSFLETVMSSGNSFSHDDPEYIGERDLESEGGYDPDE